MEYVDGRPLEGPITLAQALDYAGQILDALDHAHRRGVLHRDLKPANILLTKSGVKPLDFGLAKVERAAARGTTEETRTVRITQQGTVVGTPHYMAPEQVDGREVDARTDIFAFGAVLYELITGRKAFEGKSPASVMTTVMRDEPGAAPELSGPVELLLRRCLAKDPDERWQSARDLRWALRQVRDACPPRSQIECRDFGWRRRRWRWPPRLPSSHGAGRTGARSRLSNDTRFTIRYAATAISPSGRLLVFAAARGSIRVRYGFDGWIS
jgi:serine/threonine protein kinase